MGRNNLEWLALEVCSTLAWEGDINGTIRNVFERWCSAFQGMHTLCSFTTVSSDLATPGRYFAALLDGRWMQEIFGIGWIGGSPFRVIDAWFLMTSIAQDDIFEAAVMWGDTEGTNTREDFIHGHGYVSPDPNPGGWFMWTWWARGC
jgi:hypothetical protein